MGHAEFISSAVVLGAPGTRSRSLRFSAHFVGDIRLTGSVRRRLLVVLGFMGLGLRV